MDVREMKKVIADIAVNDHAQDPRVERRNLTNIASKVVKRKATSIRKRRDLNQKEERVQVKMKQMERARKRLNKKKKLLILSKSKKKL
jgi:hypothetical protein